LDERKKESWSVRGERFAVTSLDDVCRKNVKKKKRKRRSEQKENMEKGRAR
jgi:hypothetical protein